MDDKIQAALDRATKACISYYQLPECKPTKQNFDLWIKSLAEPIKSDFKKKGFEGCQGILNYKRFILELADIGLENYLREHLSSEDFDFWKSHKESQ
jgi:hypothetical protein